MNTVRGSFLTTAFLAFIVASQHGTSYAEEILLSTKDSPIEYTWWNQGWWSVTFANANTANVSPLIGFVDSDDHRDFFTFLLPSTLSNTTIISATLLQSRGQNSVGNESQETIGLFDVNTDAAVLNHNVGTSATIFADLGTGVNFGQFDIPGNGPADAILEFPLNASGLSDLVAHIGNYFSIGGTLLSNNGNDYLFGPAISGPTKLRLVTVPEPSTLLLLGIGAISLLGYRNTKSYG